MVMVLAPIFIFINNLYDSWKFPPKKTVAETILGANEGDADCQYILANRFLYGDSIEKDTLKAIEWYSKAAEQGHSEAQYRLGLCYANGCGVEESREQAEMWYRKAADQGHIWAKYHVDDKGEIAERIEKILRMKDDNSPLDGEKKYNSKELEKLKKSAEEGDDDSQYDLARCYLYGNGVRQNYVRAFELYRKSAEQNNENAMNSLGYCYDMGYGVEKNVDSAFVWYLKAAGKNNDVAKYNVGLCYYYGTGVTKDRDEARKYFYEAAYRKAGRRGGNVVQYVPAVHRLGVYYYDNKDYKDAFRKFVEAADYDYAKSMTRVAICYEEGHGTERDYLKALEWYFKSVEMNNTAAMNNIANCFYEGIGVERDYSLALRFLHKAAERNDDVALFNLGERYEHGRGVERNMDKAVEYYHKAGEAGYRDATYRLVELYEAKLVESDYAGIVAQLETFAADGEEKAQIILAIYYQNGYGVGKDLVKAKNILTKLANKSNREAQYQLGLCFENGLGVKKNLKTAARWYGWAASSSDIDVEAKAKEALERVNGK